MGGLLVGAPALFNLHRSEPALFWAWQVLCGSMLCFVVVVYVGPNLWMHRHFRLSVFADHIECESPHPSFGPSYRIAFSEIQLIERDARGEGDAKWTVVTHAGDRIPLSYNYGNPVSRIVGLLQAARSDLQVRDITWQSERTRRIAQQR